MSRTSTPAAGRKTAGIAIAGVIVATAVIGAALAWQPTWQSNRWSKAAAANDAGYLAPKTGHRVTAPEPAVSKAGGLPPGGLPPRQDAALEDGSVTEADGIVPGNVTVFNETYPAVSKLQPQLLQALREAATDAAADGIVFYVNSGWRSPQYQDQLLRQAVAKYGSEAEAARWVATADTSAHVSGDAADIGENDAAAWLSRRGARYGLCQIYANEPWHYELRSGAAERGCPAMYADPTADPRMHKRA